MVGMHGTYDANMATTECDLLIGIGVRFDDRVTGLLACFAPEAKIIHFDIDPAEINKNVPADIRVVGDLRWALPEFIKSLGKLDFAKLHESIKPWQHKLQLWKKEHPLGYKERPGVIMPQALFETVSKITEGNALIVTDVGQHQMWTAQFYNFKYNRTLLTSGGLGTMGFGLPAAIGAQMGMKDKLVIMFAGDGGIMMNCQELATAANKSLPIKLFVLNNQVLGMVKQWQRMFYGERYSHTCLKGQTDFVKLAEAMGVTGLRATKQEELESVVKKAFETPGPVLVDVWVPGDEDVLPMVPAGARLDQMILEAKL
jgi:acetolactate synthase-1/2/3 large subunit